MRERNGISTAVPEPQAILYREDGDGECLEGAEPGPIASRQFGHRLGHERGDVERDEADDEGVEQTARPIIAAADLDDLVDLPPQSAPARAQTRCHPDEGAISRPVRHTLAVCRLRHRAPLLLSAMARKCRPPSRLGELRHLRA
jgi:hypothetical protein